MSDILLRPGRRLNGPHRVTATVRPLRLAYLVAPDDPGVALAAIDACCLLWGGARQALIPCPSGGAPDAFWGAILEAHDPDELIDLVGASQDYLELQKQEALRPTRRWTYPTETMLLRGALLTSILRRQVEVGEWSPGHAILRFHPLFGHAFALPLAYRHGHLERRPMGRHDPMHEAYVEVQLETLVQLHRVDPRRIPDEELVRLVTEYPLAPSTPEEPGYIGPPAHCLIDLAAALGKDVSVSWRLDTQTDEPRRYGDPSWHQLVVVGEPDSVPDLCLAWSLRTLRPANIEPIWVSPTWLADASVRARLQVAREENRRLDRGRLDPRRAREGNCRSPACVPPPRCAPRDGQGRRHGRLHYCHRERSPAGMKTYGRPVRNQIAVLGESWRRSVWSIVGQSDGRQR